MEAATRVTAPDGKEAAIRADRDMGSRMDLDQRQGPRTEPAMVQARVEDLEIATAPDPRARAAAGKIINSNR